MLELIVLSLNILNSRGPQSYMNLRFLTIVFIDLQHINVYISSQYELAASPDSSDANANGNLFFKPVSATTSAATTAASNQIWVLYKSALCQLLAQQLNIQQVTTNTMKVKLIIN